MTSPSTQNDRGAKDASRSPRVIKRYANRKLYDTRDSRYVTLLQIAEYVRQGEDVSIIDNTTKEDLTNITLAQIVYEEERKSGDEARRGAGTMSTLRGLIQQSGERLITSLREGPVGKLIARREDGTPETEIAVPAPAPEPVAAPAEGAKAERRLMSPKEAFDELQRLADDRIRSVLGVAIGHVHNLQNEVKGLQARIEELEQKLVAAQKRRDHEPDAKDAKDKDAG
ncbi:MAG: polyhydroxyalkanoate synthesis regulator DNA-binding domain-containing protein [Sandaracinus sp.]